MIIFIIIAFLVSISIISAFLTYIFSIIGVKYRFVGRDNFKKNHPHISTLGGYPLMIATVIGLLVLLLSNFTSFKYFVSSLLSLVIFITIGLIDDNFPDLPGYFKPVGTMIAGLPLILLHTYKPSLAIFGGIVFHLPIVYPLLILIAFSVVPNSVNMLDVINGSAVSGVIFVLLSAIIGYYLKFNHLAMLPVLFLAILVGFLIFNIYPAKIFLGNTGSLLLGYYILLSAIFYRVEFICLIAMFPFIHNSFFYLNKVKGFIEHKKLSAQVTYFNDKDGLIYDACDDSAPLTLLRFVVSNTPKTEFESYLSMLIPFSLSFLLSIVTALILG